MATRLKLDLAAGTIEVEGEGDFVQSVYNEFKDQLLARRVAVDHTRENLFELLDEARVSSVWAEYSRAHQLYSQALGGFTRDLGNSVLADILEGIEQTRAAIKQTELEFPGLEAAVREEPENPEKHFFLALALSRLGHENEAVAEYGAALSNPEGLCDACFRDLWNNIGWYYFRQGDPREALRWFEQTCQVANVDEAFGKGNCALAMENKILCYSALGMGPEAGATAREYIRRYGRVPWPERRALAKLEIDADSLYIEQRGETKKHGNPE